MIYDTLSEFSLYEAIHPLFPEVSQFIQTVSLEELAEGKHPLSNGAYVSKSHYSTVEVVDAFIECHRRYIDIQMLLNGQEQIGVCHRNDCRAEPYLSKEDLQILHGDVAFITLKPGNFALFFPHDGHMPQVCVTTPAQVTKLVFKIPVSQ